MARLQQDIAAAREVLIASNALFRERGEAVGQMLAAAAIIRTYHFEYNTFEPMDPWVDEIDRLLADGPVFPSPAIELAVYSAVLLAITYRLPGHRLRLSVPPRVRQLLDEVPDANQRVGGAVPLVIYYTLAHDFDAGIPLIAEVSSVVGHDNVAALNRVYWWLFAGYFWHRLGQRQRADDALSLSARIAEENGLRQTYFISGCFRSYHYSSWGDVKRAAAALEGLEGMLDDRKPMLAAQYHNASFFVEAWRGNLHAAEAHANLAITAARRLGAPFFLVAWQSQTSTALAMTGAYDLCETHLEVAWQVSEGSFLETYRPMMLATRMFMEFQRGRRDEGQQVLRRLLEIAPDERALSYLRGVPRLRETFVCEALQAGLCVPLIQSVVRAWEVAPPAPDVPDWPWRVRIHTLGGFRVEVDGEPLTFSGKTPRKPIALLKAIVAFGGRDVPGRRLIDALWADEEGDKAADALAVGLHRLRKLLGNADAVIFQDGVVSLDPAHCWVDVWSLQHLLRDSPSAMPDDVDVERACALYAGAFLTQDTDAPWTALMRERLRSGFLRFLLEVGRTFESTGRTEDAVRIYARGIDIDELAEDLYQGQMRCLDRLERRAEALSVFRRLRQALSVSLGIAPSAATQRLFRDIQEKAQSVPDR